MEATATLVAIAESLATAEATRRPTPPLTSKHPELTVADAYEIQSLNARARVEAGAEVVGHKIGLTAKPMQEMLGVDEPDFGRLFSDDVAESGISLDASELIAPRVEPEIAFILGGRLAGPGVTREDVIAATDYVVPALEVIDSRIADWKIKLVDTIADNASCARVVLGTKRTSISAVDLASETVDLKRNGNVVEHGAGEAVLGHPAEAIAWLANAVAGHGVELEPGHVLMPGSLTAAIDFEPGDGVRADFGTLGSVEVSCR